MTLMRDKPFEPPSPNEEHLKSMLDDILAGLSSEFGRGRDTSPQSSDISIPQYSLSDARNLIAEYHNHKCESINGCAMEAQVRAFLAAQWPKESASYYCGMFNGLMSAKVIAQVNFSRSPLMGALGGNLANQLSGLIVATGIQWVKMVENGNVDDDEGVDDGENVFRDITEL